MENTKLQASTEIQPVVNSLKEIVLTELSAAFAQEIKAYTDFIKQYQESLSHYSTAFNKYQTEKDSITFLNKTVGVYFQVSEALKKSFDEKEPTALATAFQSILEKALLLFAELSRTEQNFIFNLLKSTQEKQESQRSKLERLGVKIRKAFSPKPKIDVKDTINLIVYTFFEQSIASVLKEKETELLAFYHRLSELTLSNWDTFNSNTSFIKKLDEADYNFENLDSASLNNNLDISANDKLEAVVNDFQHFSANIALTIENTVSQYDFSSLVIQKDKLLSLNEINKTQIRNFQKIEKNTVLWRKTRFVLIEDWLLDIEIFSLKHKIIQKYIEFTQILNDNFSSPFNKEIDAFELQFGLLNEYFDKSSGLNSDKDVQSNLLDLKLQLKTELLDKSLPLLRKQLNSPMLIEEIDAFESLAEKSFASLSEVRQLMKKPDYLREVGSDEIDSISPRDLISFEIKPAFILIFAALKRALIAHTQSLLNQLETAPNIAIYSIESASKLYEEKKQVDEVNKMCNEGIARSREKVSETKSLNETFINTETEKLKAAIDKLVFSLTEITNNESALQIKIRIVRAKAIARSKEIRKQIITNVLNFLPILYGKLKLSYRFIEEFSQKFAKQFALHKTDEFITTDISHYLTTAQLSISKLPYIYQRLFSFEPLDTFELYIERNQPMEELKAAYANWKQEKFAPVVIIGERGSGKTTFIRKFIQSEASSEKIILLDLSAENKGADENYQQILNIVLLKKKRSDEKKIVIIDGFERLFESKINGFDFLLAFFKIISDTQKDIFWIVSVHSISWSYFDKSVQASNYFGYHIHLNKLEFNDLVNLIESRHNLSGYKVVFEQQQKKKSLLGNKKYDAQDPQIELRKNFFLELNKSVQGNILQAYIYWLRSAQLSENNTIRIQTDNQLNFDFVRGIPHQKLHILKSILIHNGLTVETLAISFRISNSKSELDLKQLFDDGIIRLKNQVYHINPLIYRQLIKHLKDINLLH